MAKLKEVGPSARVLLDGFPRTRAQAEALDGNSQVGIALNLQVPVEEIVARISDRWVHPPSGRIYAYSYNPPKVEGRDDETGEPLVQRDDDKPEAVRSRLEVFQNVTEPVLDFYRKMGICQDFHGTESKKIYPNVDTYLKSIL